MVNKIQVIVDNPEDKLTVKIYSNEIGTDEPNDDILNVLYEEE